MPFTLYRVEDANQGGPYNGADKQLVRDALPHLFSSERRLRAAPSNAVR
jgi:hypothetical protein